MLTSIIGFWGGFEFGFLRVQDDQCELRFISRKNLLEFTIVTLKSPSAAYKTKISFTAAKQDDCFSHLVVSVWVNRVQSSTATWWVEGMPEKSI